MWQHFVKSQYLDRSILLSTKYTAFTYFSFSFFLSTVPQLLTFKCHNCLHYFLSRLEENVSFKESLTTSQYDSPLQADTSIHHTVLECSWATHDALRSCSAAALVPFNKRKYDSFIYIRAWIFSYHHGYFYLLSSYKQNWENAQYLNVEEDASYLVSTCQPAHTHSHIYTQAHTHTHAHWELCVLAPSHHFLILSCCSLHLSS